MPARKKPAGAPQTRQRKQAEKRQRAARRRRLRVIRFVAAGALLIAVAAAFLVRGRLAEARVRDLSAIGQGVPSVVQVHDVSCPVCTQLRSNVKRIDQNYDEDDLLIRVADIRTESGLAFAARYTNERWRTLLFLDGEGNLVDQTTGLIEVDALRELFDAHARER